MMLAVRSKNENGHQTWKLCVALADTKKQCRLSFRGALPRTYKGRPMCNAQTGRCGLSGLIAIRNMVNEFLEEIGKSGKDFKILAVPCNAKRRRAYRYLERLGFKYHAPDERCSEGHYRLEKGYSGSIPE